MRIVLFAVALTLLSAPSISGPSAQRPQVQPATIPSGTELIISHANYDAGVYLLKFTKYEDGSVTLAPLNAQVVGLDGQRIDNGGGFTPGEPDPEIGLLDAVKANFADVSQFTKQRDDLIEALSIPDGLELLEANKFVQGQMALALNNDAEKWEPWLAWFRRPIADGSLNTAQKYRDWIDQAAVSLED